MSVLEHHEEWMHLPITGLSAEEIEANRQRIIAIQRELPVCIERRYELQSKVNAAEDALVHADIELKAAILSGATDIDDKIRAKDDIAASVNQLLPLLHAAFADEAHLRELRDRLQQIR